MNIQITITVARNLATLLNILTQNNYEYRTWDTFVVVYCTDAQYTAVMALCEPYMPTKPGLQIRRELAKSEAALSLEFKHLSPQQAVDYIETNVTTLASAKTVLKIMARILIAIVWHIWPEMADE